MAGKSPLLARAEQGDGPKRLAASANRAEADRAGAGFAFGLEERSIDQGYYELRVLSELRHRLRAGDVG